MIFQKKEGEEEKERERAKAVAAAHELELLLISLITTNRRVLNFNIQLLPEKCKNRLSE